MKHTLSHTILEQGNCNLIIILDTSEYANQTTPVTNPLFRITLPDFDEYVDLQYNIFNVTTIKPQNLKCNTLPDGLYTITQSVCPNEKTKVTTQFLKTSCLEQEIICEACSEDTDKLVDLLFKLQIAKGLVEECCEKAIDLFNVVKKEFNQLKNCC